MDPPPHLNGNRDRDQGNRNKKQGQGPGNNNIKNKHNQNQQDDRKPSANESNKGRGKNENFNNPKEANGPKSFSNKSGNNGKKDHSNHVSNNSKKDNHHGNHTRSNNHHSISNQSHTTSNNRPVFDSNVLSSEESQYWRQLENKLQLSNKDGKFYIEKSKMSTWFGIWKAAALNVHGNIQCLISCLLKLPAKDSAIPPVSDVLAVLSIYMNNLSSTTEFQRIKNDITRVLDVIKLMLSPVINKIKTEHKELALQNFKKLSEAMVNKAVIDIGFLSEVVNCCKTFENEITRHQPDGFMDPNETQVVPWLGWQNNPPVGWLLSKEWHNIGSNVASQFNDVDEYTEHFLKVWTLLAFYWGGGAVSPRCSFKSGETVCGEPLLFFGLQNGYCKHCKEAAATCGCYRRDHDKLCDRCFRNRQIDCLGSPGNNSSTDIYDCKVENVATRHNVGTIYHVGQLASRKPPKIEANWKTTYRLQPSALIAVIRLSCKGEPIDLKHRMSWAEIVCHDVKDKFGEFKFRQRQQLSFRLLSSNDCHQLPDDGTVHFASGSQLAIIDLRIFVPEVISILNILSKPEFRSNLKQLPFADVLVGKRNVPSRNVVQFNDSIADMVCQAILISEIKVLRSMPGDLKLRVASRINQLTVVKTLDRTQLEAFCAALISSIHCTQGPPGTGKSYVGVCLVLSFLIIKEEAQKLNSRKLGPILALSYKNHALDEFLLDIIHKCQENQLNIRKKLIRNGNAENEELKEFEERKVKEEYVAQEEFVKLCSIHKNYKVLDGDIREYLESVLQTNRIIFDWSGRFELPKHSVTNECMLLFLMLSLLLSLNNVSMDGVDADSEGKNNYNTLLETNPKKLECSAKNIEGFLNEFFVSAVSHWSEYYKHSNETIRILKILNCWMLGMNPPPVCQFAKCRKEARGDFKFCKKHICRGENTNGNNCGNCIVSEQHMYCRQHKCSTKYTDCSSIQLFGSKYCSEHSCLGCFECNLESIDCCEEGGKSCKKHQCAMCKTMKIFPSMFCLEHSCVECVKSKLEDIAPRIEGSNFCLHHKCQINNCAKKCEHGSTYCTEHTCKLCLMYNVKIPNRAEDEEPRNVCVRHPLCTYIFADGDTCNESCLILEDGSECQYCEYHWQAHESSQGKCIASLDGGKCREDVKVGSFYCPGHVNWDVSQPMQCVYVYNNDVRCREKTVGSIAGYCMGHKKLEKSDIICLGMTKKGKNCNKKAANGSLYCEDHSQQENIPVCVDIDIKINFHPDEEEISDYARRCEMGNCIIMRICREPFYCSMHTKKNSSSESKVESLKSGELDSNESKEPPPITPLLPQISLGAGISSIEKGDVIFLTNEDIGEDHCNYDVNPDELDINPDDFEQGESDNQVHLQEVINNEDGDEIDSESVEAEDNDNTFLLDEGIKDEVDYILDGLRWSATMDERMQFILSILARVRRRIKVVLDSLKEDISNAQQNVYMAKSKAYREALVVGSTVVGASRRLDAIAYAEPFAVIVEEACEVMEPALIAVLGVRSISKLEMIGDHRQLPAFVQNCWFSLETRYPFLKESLFERIVKFIPPSILHSQRRMRKEIADITRPDYKDLLLIEDHPKTSIQRIGDTSSLKKESLNLLQNSWCASGRNIPGSSKVVYFWNIPNNSESRPVAGLSACNETEAKAVVAMVKWFLLCDVPKECITVLTPYKGQKTLILKLLREAGCVPKAGYLDNSVNNKNILISTVDRYQGDENDIVILSLVRVKPGNRFVHLKNRFIVATSRARLGFFVVGSIPAVEASTHWKRFLDYLHVDPNVGVGESFPIQCPFHHNTNKLIKKIDEFPVKQCFNSFCNKPCKFKLPRCDHPCQLPCHSWSSRHNEQCKEVLRRPCVDHELIPLLCHEAGGDNLKQSLLNFKCRIKEERQRIDCSHKIQLECYTIADYTKHPSKYPLCEEVVSDYVKPCSHIIPSPKCHQKASYQLRPPRCDEQVEFKRRCGHISNMKCFEKDRESIQPTLCFQEVKFHRPRCHHLLTLECYKMRKMIEEWDLNSYLEADLENRVTVVEANVNYGPSQESFCKVRCAAIVKYRRVCGHEVELQCSDAFDYAMNAKKIEKCCELVEYDCPICTSRVSLPCWVTESLNDTQLLDINIQMFSHNNELVEYVSEDYLVQQARIDFFHSNEILNALKQYCVCTMHIRRKCNHVDKVTCANIVTLLSAQKKLAICRKDTVVPLSCNHEVTVACCEKANVKDRICKEIVNKQFFYSCREHYEIVKYCHETNNWNVRNPECKNLTQCRIFRCGHEIETYCKYKNSLEEHQPGRILEDESIDFDGIYCKFITPSVQCNRLVTFRRSCTHVSQVPCWTGFDWNQNSDKIDNCVDGVEVINPLCGHDLILPCYSLSSLREWQPWERDNGPFTDPDNTYIDEESLVPYRPFPLAGVSVVCEQIVKLIRKCDHLVDMKCGEILSGKIPKCSTIELLRCGADLHDNEVPCYITRSTEPYKCTQLRNVLCTICNVNEVTVSCYKATDEVRCNSVVEVQLECGHEYKYNCGTEADPRSIAFCRKCIEADWNKGLRHKLDDDIMAALPVVFMGIIEKEVAKLQLFEESCELLPDLRLQDWKVHFDARNEILKKCLDLCLKGIINENIGQFPDISRLEEDFDKYYQLVYTTMPKANEYSSIKGHFKTAKATVYGAANELTLYNDLSISQFSESELDIVIGVVFSKTCKDDVSPFIDKTNNKNNKIANNLRNEKLAKGIDAIVSREKNNIFVWTKGAAIPICRVKGIFGHECRICMDRLGIAAGCLCGSKHFLCWNCLSLCASNAKNVDTVGKTVDKSGNLLCPSEKCNQTFSLDTLLKYNAPAEVCNDVMSVRIHVEVNRNVQDALTEQEKKHNAQLRKILEEQDQKKQRAEMLRLTIVEDILTLKCPRCKGAFLDFDGCFAVTCTCRAGFCGWCLKDCGNDAHAHVANCPENKANRDVFSSREVFNRHHAERKKRLLVDRLKREDPEIANQVKVLLKKELEDLKIKL